MLTPETRLEQRCNARAMGEIERQQIDPAAKLGIQPLEAGRHVARLADDENVECVRVALTDQGSRGEDRGAKESVVRREAERGFHGLARSSQSAGSVVGGGQLAIIVDDPIVPRAPRLNVLHAGQPRRQFECGDQTLDLASRGVL